jgi:type I site-specific restriction endonuclease
MEQLLREYEIRLAAHRRALLERESELEAAKRRITELRKPVEPESARKETTLDEQRTTPPPVLTSPSPLPTVFPSPSPTPVAARGTDETLVSSLQHELDVERENRATLEQEIQRLLSESRPPEQFQAVAQSLDGARAQLLLLNQRLAEEQRARESLEVTLERVRETAGVAPGADWLERFDATMRERRAQGERLEEELRNANEAIVQLKAKLEAQERRPPETGPNQETQSLEAEVARLREALHNAEQANADLRTQAELAGRLADMLYGQSQTR